MSNLFDKAFLTLSSFLGFLKSSELPDYIDYEAITQIKLHEENRNLFFNLCNQ
jgi:hypothetical protein